MARSVDQCMTLLVAPAGDVNPSIPVQSPSLFSAVLFRLIDLMHVTVLCSCKSARKHGLAEVFWSASTVLIKGYCIIAWTVTDVLLCVCMCVCVCVRERERERER